MEPVKVYWMPGCSSCVKVKEFLSKKGVDYISVNVSSEPEEMQFLASLGVRTVPVVVRGTDYVFAQSLDDVAQFVGIEHTANMLPAAVLMERWFQILEQARYIVSQIQEHELALRPVAERPRTIRDLAFHIFQVPDAFLQTVMHGLEDWTLVANVDAPSDISVAGVLEYGKSQIDGVADWWNTTDDRTCSGLLTMFYGTHTLHSFLERSVWHTAQHTRQLAWWSRNVAKREISGLSDTLLEGLPMPQGLWE